MRTRTNGFAAALLVVAASCRHAAPPALGPMPWSVDSTRTQIVADGVSRRLIRSAHGPWTVNVLYVDLDRCNSAVAVKGADTSVGRFKTTELLSGLAAREQVIGGVNADFFNLADGSPTNLLVVNGRMLARPNSQPVLAFDSTGAPRIARFTLTGGRLFPFHPRHAVGGRPILVMDSVIVDAVDTEGAVSFRERNPRTAAGIARGGKRLILAVVDGREYQNAGMTLRETAELMLALGAHDAINLDGGGSTTFVYTDPDSSGRLRIANRPSDKEGERTVGNALAVVHGCPSKR